MYRLCITFAKTFLVYTVNIESSINIKSTLDFAQFYRFSITGNSKFSPVKLKCTLIDESKNLIFLVRKSAKIDIPCFKLTDMLL